MSLSNLEKDRLQRKFSTYGFPIELADAVAAAIDSGYGTWRSEVDCVDSVSLVQPTGANPKIDSHTVLEGERVLFRKLTAQGFDHRIFKAVNVAHNVQWQLEYDGQAGNGDPTTGEMIYVRGGLKYGNAVWVFTGEEWIRFPYSIEKVNAVYIENEIGFGDTVLSNDTATTTDATPTALANLALEEDAVYVLKAEVVCLEVGGTNAGKFRREALVRYTGVVQSVQTPVPDIKTVPGYGVTIDVVDGAARVVVTGKDSVKWLTNTTLMKISQP